MPQPTPLPVQRPRLAVLLVLAAVTLAQAGVPPQGTANLDIHAAGGTLEVELEAASTTLVGFAGVPGTAAQRADLKLAAQNLKAGDALVRFNTQAQCVLETARVDADPRVRKGAADLGASYRFGCARPDLLSSAALGLFAGFPALARVHAHYETALGRGAAVLTPGNPVVTFVPLQ